MPKLDIKPCPFCGGPAKVKFSPYANNPDKGTYIYVYCMNCYAQGKKMFDEGRYDVLGANAMDEPVVTAAVAYWNKRVPIDE